MTGEAALMESVRPDDSAAPLAALRHDLLNAINVLVGATSGLRADGLTERQRAWVRMLESATTRLVRVAGTMGREETARDEADRARFADLCSIAAARVSKPFDRQQLLDAIAAIGGHNALRILLVDDSQELVAVVQSYLEGTPWTLDAVETGERAVTRAAAEHYDVVLMDIDLPGLD